MTLAGRQMAKTGRLGVQAVMCVSSFNTTSKTTYQCTTYNMCFLQQAGWVQAKLGGRTAYEGPYIAQGTLGG